jgi:MYXO-CTERM domain-containing protein
MEIKPIFSAQLAAAALALTLATPAQATLVARDLNGDTVTDAFYDTALNITWLRNANAGAGSSYDNGSSTTDGLMTWANANDWANNLVSGGYSDWRLPTMVRTSLCYYGVTGGNDCGYNVPTATSEMAHLFYVDLGNLAYYAPATGAYQPNYGLKNTGDFLNMQSYVYWFGTEYGSSEAWRFYTTYGDQFYTSKHYQYYALAVRPGDVLAATVPEPGAGLLALAALAGLGFIRRRAVGPSGL